MVQRQWFNGNSEGVRRWTAEVMSGILDDVSGQLSNGDDVLLMTAVHPILPVRDLHRSEVFYRRLGLQATFHHPDYLIMRAGPVELQFGRVPEPAPVSCYVDTEDAGRLWTRFHSLGVEGLGPVEDFDYGMREFVLTDPDGNRLRVGSSIPGR